MTDATSGVRPWLDRGESELYARLTTVGHPMGGRHRIDIWFAIENGRIYVVSADRVRSNWVQNLLANPLVTVEPGFDSHPGVDRIVQQATSEGERARDLLVNKYATPGNPLRDRKRRSLAIAIEFEDGAIESAYRNVRETPQRPSAERQLLPSSHRQNGLRAKSTWT